MVTISRLADPPKPSAGDARMPIIALTANALTGEIEALSRRGHG